MKQILRFLEEKNPEPINGYIWAIVLFCVYFVKAFVVTHGMLLMSYSGMRVYNILASLIYDKILKMSNASKKYLDTGKIMNHATVDLGAINNFINMGS